MSVGNTHHTMSMISIALHVHDATPGPAPSPARTLRMRTLALDTRDSLADTSMDYSGSVALMLIVLRSIRTICHINKPCRRLEGKPYIGCWSQHNDRLCISELQYDKYIISKIVYLTIKCKCLQLLHTGT